VDKLNINEVKKIYKIKHISDAMLGVILNQIAKSGPKKSQKYYTKKLNELKKTQDTKSTDAAMTIYDEILSLIAKMEKSKGKNE
jgi:hypothetical protein